MVHRRPIIGTSAPMVIPTSLETVVKPCKNPCAPSAAKESAEADIACAAIIDNLVAGSGRLLLVNRLAIVLAVVNVVNLI